MIELARIVADLIKSDHAVAAVCIFAIAPVLVLVLVVETILRIVLRRGTSDSKTEED